MPEPTILFYSPMSALLGPALRRVCAQRGLRLRVVAEGDLERPIAALARGLKPMGVQGGAGPLSEAVMVLCHVPREELDDLLAALRREGFTCLKAVLTPTNAGWSLRRLYEELARERAQMEGK